MAEQIDDILEIGFDVALAAFLEGLFDQHRPIRIGLADLVPHLHEDAFEFFEFGRQLLLGGGEGLRGRHRRSANRPRPAAKPCSDFRLRSVSAGLGRGNGHSNHTANAVAIQIHMSDARSTSLQHVSHSFSPRFSCSVFSVCWVSSCLLSMILFRRCTTLVLKSSVFHHMIEDFEHFAKNQVGLFLGGVTAPRPRRDIGDSPFLFRFAESFSRTAFRSTRSLSRTGNKLSTMYVQRLQNQFFNTFLVCLVIQLDYYLIVARISSIAAATSAVSKAFLRQFCNACKVRSKRRVASSRRVSVLPRKTWGLPPAARPAHHPPSWPWVPQ